MSDPIPYTLDEILDYSDYSTVAARSELAALRESEKYWQAQAETERANAAGQRDRAEELRAKAEEYDRIAELIDPTDCSIYDQIVYLLNDDSSDVELRATVAEQARQIDRIPVLEKIAIDAAMKYSDEHIKNAEQARRLEEAHTVIDEALYSLRMYGASVAANACRDWLAANAPAQAEQEQAG